MPDDNEEKTIDNKNDENNQENTDVDNEHSEDAEQKPFDNLDLKKIYVFGQESNASENCWYNLSLKAKTIGWKKIDVKQIELSLKRNVDACYFYLASLYFVDLDDDTRYHAFFDSNKGLWRLEIEDSPDADLDIQQISDFFKSNEMQKAAKQCYDIIIRAKKEYDESLKTHIESGELLEVDEVKLSAILYFINQDITMQNLRTCKWMNAD